MLMHIAYYFGARFLGTCRYNVDISGNKCRKRCLKGVNKYPKSETDLFHKVTVTEMIVFKGYLHR